MGLLTERELEEIERYITEDTEDGYWSIRTRMRSLLRKLLDQAGKVQVCQQCNGTGYHMKSLKKS